MAFQMKTMEGVHGKHICLCARHYVIICFACYGKLTNHVLVVLVDVLGTSSSKGKGPA